MESAIGARVTIVDGDMLAVAHGGSIMAAPVKAKTRGATRAFWTIAVIDGCHGGVSPVAALASRKRRGAGRGGRGDRTAVHLPAMQQADVHL